MPPEISPEVFFLPTSVGVRFCIFHAAQAAHGPAAHGSDQASDSQRGSILYVHAFAEEMNKTRRMAALQARRLARQGWSVLQIDLGGCGDSAGDFGDATWEGWRADLHAAWQWLEQRQPGSSSSQRWLWGTRVGALLVADFALQCIPQATGLLLWQPVTSGAQYLNQFLRLRSVQGLFGAESGATVQVLRTGLLGGTPLEVAGYTLHPQLAAGLQDAELGKMAALPSHILWFDVVNSSGTSPVSAASAVPATLSPASTRTIDALRTRNVQVDAQTVDGPAFWQTQEIEIAPALLDATDAALHAFCNTPSP